MIKLSSLLFGFFLVVRVAMAQVPNQVTQPTEWFAVNSSFNFGKTVGVVFDGNFRFVGRMQGMQHMLRGGLEFQVARNLSVIPFGYAYVWNYRYGEQPAAFANNEFRFWHQVQYKMKLGRVSLGQRLRLEERSIQRHHTDAAHEGIIMDDGFTNHQGRVRYRAYFTVPLKKDITSGYWYVNWWDEVHFGWGKAVKSVQPNQNRAFAGLGYQFNKSTSLQAGVIYQLLKKDNGTQRENNIGGMMQLNLGFDLLKSR